MRKIVSSAFYFLLAISVFVVLPLNAVPAQAADSKGTSFFLSFQPNLSTGANDNVAIFLSSDLLASGLVQVPSLSFSQSFTIQPGEVIRVDMPSSIRNLPSNAKSNLGIQITSNEEITVYGLNQYRYTTDAFLALPTDVLGTDYRVMSYYGLFQSQAGIVGVYDGTEVTINSVLSQPGSSQSQPSSAVTIELNSGETYLFNSSGSNDITGTRISSSAPVAVFGGNRCTNVPNGRPWCDHTVEMLPPVATWGNNFLTVPLATRRNGEVFRVLASEDSTEVTINGDLVSTINAGEFYETVLRQRSIITATSPVLVAQYSPGQSFDGVVSDPFMMLVPPSEQFLNSYSFAALEEALGFVNNFVNVVAPTADVPTISLDGVPVDTSLFVPIGDSGFSGAQIPISEGNHNMSGPQPFGIYVYGFGSFDSYGYPGGMNFDLINSSGDQYAPNVKLITMDNVIEGIAGDSEDINLNDFLDAGEDLNGNAILDRRTEDINGNGELDAGEDTNDDDILDRDTGIFRIELADGAQNLQLSLDNFIPGTLRATFTISVVDPNLPSSGTLVIQDGAGNSVSEEISFSNETVLQNVRVISTLSTVDIDLDQTSFVRAPDSIDVSGTETVIEWQFSSIAIGQIENLSYDIVFKNPEPDEARLVTHDLELYYDDVEGNPVYQALGQQVVNVLSSVFALQVATDRQDYTFEQVVSISTDLSNLSQFDTVSSVELVILDANGNLVATVGTFDSLALAANEMANLDMSEFNTGSTYLGTYTVRAILRDENDAEITRADTDFNIVADTEMLYAATVTTDKPTYAPGETVSIQDRVSNPAPNAILSGASAVTTLTAPDGSEFWRAERAVPDIAVQSLFDFFHSVDLGVAQPGEYQVALSLRDNAGVERALSTRTITVTSTQDTGVGLLAQIQATPSPVLKTEDTTLNLTLTNQGNSAINDVPVTVSVINVQDQQVLQSWDLGTVSLAIDGVQSFGPEWFANVAVGNQYAVVVNGIIGGEERVLATQNLAVAEKFLTSLAVEGKGRLLVLLDEDGSTGASCQGLSQVDLRFRPDAVLLPEDELYVDLYDTQGGLLNSENLTVGNFVGPVNISPSATTDVVLTAATADHLDIRLQSGDATQLLNGGVHSMTVTHRQAGSSTQYFSGDFGTGCADVADGQSLTNELQVVSVLGSDGADPYGPDGAPTKLTQRRFLEGLLDQAGWSYTIVDTSEAFSTELNTGGYAVAALLNEQAKLAESVQDDLLLAVEQGLGLVYAGYHDKRNGRIEPALGIGTRGKLTHVTGLELFASPLQELAENLNFNFDVKPLRVDLNGATSLALYQSSKSGSESAITDYQYGVGQSVYMGFDVLVQATTLGDDSTYASLLLNALAHVHPDSLAPIAGNVLPISLTVENFGMLASGQLLLSLPEGANVVDPGLGREIDPNTLLLPFTVDTNGKVEWPFWIRLPDVAGEVQLLGEILVTIDGQLISYGPLQLTLDVVVP